MSNKQVGFFNGNLGIGTKHPQSSVHIDRNDAMILPKGTTSQRPVQQLTDGMIRYNSTNNNVEAYSQNKWVRLAEADAQSEFRLEQAKMTNENGNLQPTWANSVAVEMNFNKIQEIFFLPCSSPGSNYQYGYPAPLSPSPLFCPPTIPALLPVFYL